MQIESGRADPEFLTLDKIASVNACYRLRGVDEGRAPAPGVSPGQAHAAFQQVHDGHLAHAAAGAYVGVVAVA